MKKINGLLVAVTLVTAGFMKANANCITQCSAQLMMCGNNCSMMQPQYVDTCKIQCFTQEQMCFENCSNTHDSVMSDLKAWGRGGPGSDQFNNIPNPPTIAAKVETATQHAGSLVAADKGTTLGLPAEAPYESTIAKLSKDLAVLGIEADFAADPATDNMRSHLIVTFKDMNDLERAKSLFTKASGFEWGYDNAIIVFIVTRN